MTSGLRKGYIGGKMSEHWTCLECEELYDDTDGDTDERMCNKCLDKIHNEQLTLKGEAGWPSAHIFKDKIK